MIISNQRIGNADISQDFYVTETGIDIQLEDIWTNELNAHKKLTVRRICIENYCNAAYFIDLRLILISLIKYMPSRSMLTNQYPKYAI
jgi:hypothetical protein